MPPSRLPIVIGIIGILVGIVLVTLVVWVIVFQSTHTCTKWGPYYTTYVPITTNKTTTLVPVQNRDCEGIWLKNP